VAVLLHGAAHGHAHTGTDEDTREGCGSGDVPDFHSELENLKKPVCADVAERRGLHGFHDDEKEPGGVVVAELVLHASEEALQGQLPRHKRP